MSDVKVWIIAVLATATTSLHAAVPVVTNVVAQQRATTKLVDIRYDVFDADGDTLKVRVEVSDSGGNRYSVPAFSFTGDIGENVTTGANCVRSLVIGMRVERLERGREAASMAWDCAGGWKRSG